MQTYHVRLTGLCPMLFNSKTPETISKANKPPRGKADEWEEANWMNRALISDGFACQPSEAILKMLVTATGRWGEKIPGKGNQTYTEYVKASLVLPDCVPICRAEDLVPDRRCVNGSPSKKPGPTVLRVRPCAMNWAAEFDFYPASTLITPDILRTILGVAGSIIGLSDYRPRFGRFEAEVST